MINISHGARSDGGQDLRTQNVSDQFTKISEDFEDPLAKFEVRFRSKQQSTRYAIPG